MKMTLVSIVSLSLVSLVSACTDVTQNSQRAMYDIRGNIYSSAAKIQKWVEYNPPSTTPQPAQTRYCYYAMADVICYLEPQPNLSNKLVGVQGQTQSAEYTYQAPTDPVQVTNITPSNSAPVIENAKASAATSSDKDFPSSAKGSEPGAHPRGLLPQY